MPIAHKITDQNWLFWGRTSCFGCFGCVCDAAAVLCGFPVDFVCVLDLVAVLAADFDAVLVLPDRFCDAVVLAAAAPDFICFPVPDFDVLRFCAMLSLPFSMYHRISVSKMRSLNG